MIWEIFSCYKFKESPTPRQFLFCLALAEFLIRSSPGRRATVSAYRIAHFHKWLPYNQLMKRIPLAAREAGQGLWSLSSRGKLPERRGKGGRFSMLTKEDKSTPYLKTALSSLTFISSKNSPCKHILFLFSNSVALLQVLHGTWLCGGRGSVPQLSHISIGKADS